MSIKIILGTPCSVSWKFNKVKRACISVKLKICYREIHSPKLKKVVLFLFCLVWLGWVFLVGWFCLQKDVEFTQVFYVNFSCSSIIIYSYNSGSHTEGIYYPMLRFFTLVNEEEKSDKII